MVYNFSFINSSVKVDTFDFVRDYCDQLLSHNVWLLYVCFSMIFIVTIILNVAYILDKKHILENKRSLFVLKQIDYPFKKRFPLEYGFDGFIGFQLWLYRFALIWVCIALYVVLVSNGHLQWLHKLDLIFSWW